MTDTDIHSAKTLSASDVAEIFGVTVATVRSWDKPDKLPAAFRTPGGQRRWYVSDIEAARSSS